ncbi:hypothetical protein J6590_100516, partial [Homalodisca vitripennis]
GREFTSTTPETGKTSELNSIERLCSNTLPSPSSHAEYRPCPESDSQRTDINLSFRFNIEAVKAELHIKCKSSDLTHCQVIIFTDGHT